MDWIGDKLSQLINDGKRALGTEVVVMSDAQEDAVDDGSGNWEELDGPSTSSASRSNSFRRRHRPRHLPLTTSTSHTVAPASSASLRRSQSDIRSPDPSSSAIPIPDSPCRIERDFSTDTNHSYSSFHEDESEWQSSELRESMERARA